MSVQEKIKSEKIIIRVIFSVFGTALCGVSVGIFKYAALGVDAFQTLLAGLDALIPLDYGLLYILVNVVLLVVLVIWGRHYIGIATFVNLFLLGYVAQFTLWLLHLAFAEPPLAVRVVALIVAIPLLCFSISIYMSAELGVSTYDAIALILADHLKKAKFKYLRIMTDSFCLVLGVVLFMIAGGKIREIPTIAGIGTVITAFTLGPLIDAFNVHVSEPLLAKLGYENSKRK